MKKVVLSFLVIVLLIVLLDGFKVNNTRGSEKCEFDNILRQQEQLKLEGQKAFEKILASKGVKVTRGSRAYIIELVTFISDPYFKPLATKENMAIDFYATTVLNNLGRKEEESILNEVMKRNKDIREGNEVIQSSSFIYNRENAVNYAYTFWNFPNPAYKDFDDGGGGDCTNFVSQCLYYGGVPMINTIWPRWSSYDWYYYFNGPGYEDDEVSWPWANATSLYRHLLWGRQDLAVLVNYDSQLQKGDIVNSVWIAHQNRTIQCSLLE